MYNKQFIHTPTNKIEIKGYIGKKSVKETTKKETNGESKRP
jgi:hypothetical protein